jgi:hypothetical protein
MPLEIEEKTIQKGEVIRKSCSDVRASARLADALDPETQRSESLGVNDIAAIKHETWAAHD